jgi:hypothetical protein
MLGWMALSGATAMKRYHLIVNLTHPEKFDVDPLADDFVVGARPLKTFTGWGPFTIAVLDLGLDKATIKGMVGDFAQKQRVVIHDQELDDDAVARFEIIGL